MTAEEWRPVLDMKGRYEVSDLGRVRSLVRVEPRILRLRTEAGGYLSVELRSAPGVQTCMRVHRLVIEAFSERRRPEGMETRHLNGVPTDNRLANLAWGSRVENAADTRAHNHHNNGKKTHCKRGHEFTEVNTFRDRKGKRECRTCRREYFQVRDARLRAERMGAA